MAKCFAALKYDNVDNSSWFCSHLGFTLNIMCASLVLDYQAQIDTWFIMSYFVHWFVDDELSDKQCVFSVIQRKLNVHRDVWNALLSLGIVFIVLCAIRVIWVLAMIIFGFALALLWRSLLWDMTQVINLSDQTYVNPILTKDAVVGIIHWYCTTPEIRVHSLQALIKVVPKYHSIEPYIEIWRFH